MAALPRPTLKDVARLAGVSAGVASNVLSGNRNPAIRASEETQSRVREAAVALGYRPNALARSLQRQHTQTLLLAMYFIPNITKSAFHSEVLDGALTRALERTYDLTVHPVRKEDREKPGVFGDGRADGALWVAPWLDDAAISSLTGADACLTILYARVQGSHPCVVADNRQGIATAVEHLSGLGHRHLALVEGADGWRPYDLRERAAAMLEQCANRGLRGRVLRLDELEHWLRKPLDERPTGLIGWHDPLAMRAMECAQKLGLSVPEDVSVVGFDSTPLCERVRPTLTSVRQPIREMAQYAVDLLIHRIEGPDSARAESTVPVNVEGNLHLFPCRLDIRGSTGPAPTLCPAPEPNAPYSAGAQSSERSW